MAATVPGRLLVAAGVLNQVPLDWDGNQRRIAALLDEARARQVAILCLPEMCIPGYGCEDAYLAADTAAQSARVLAELLPRTRGLVACLGLPVPLNHALFNAVAVCVDGRLMGVVAKQHLAGDGIHYEPRWFKPWQEGQRTRIALAGTEAPLGDLLFEVGGLRFGIEICEDAWVARRPGQRLAAHGADLILNPSASHFAFGKQEVRRLFVAEGARAFNVAYVYANLLGNESGRIIYDGGAMVAAGGTLLATGPRLGYAEAALTCAEVDLAAVRTAARRSSSFMPSLEEWPGGPVRADHAFPAAAPSPVCAGGDAWAGGPHLKEEEFARAVALGLCDYLRKSRSQGFTVSLSGGCDSTAVAVLVHLMVRLGVAELGLEGFRRRLAHVRGLDACADVPALCRRLLTTVYQASANSSQTTRAAAATVARAVGSRHLELDIEPFVQGYRQAVSAALGREMTWERDDLALQNIQARVRAPSVWLIANLDGSLLLTTSNRTEAAVGYATMDGDTAGGLAPIAGIDKAFLRHWMEWMRTTGPQDLGPMPELLAVTAQASTPELRPASAAQRSEADLMPFPVLDRLERLAIRDKLSPAEVLSRLRAECPDRAADLAGWVRRFFTLWSRNQWKRERLAPAFHLDDENLDPKTWCRFPILSGGYERELTDLG